MATVSVTHLAADKYRVETRDHVLLADQPGDDGGVGPTPVELLVMALAACAADYAVGHLREEGLPADGVSVYGRWSMRADPARIGRVALRIEVPARLSVAEQHRLRDAVDHCTVHSTFRVPPSVEVAIADPSFAVTGGTV